MTDRQYGQRDRQKERQTDRQTDRQTARQTVTIIGTVVPRPYIQGLQVTSESLPFPPCLL